VAHAPVHGDIEKERDHDEETPAEEKIHRRMSGVRRAYCWAAPVHVGTITDPHQRPHSDFHRRGNRRRGEPSAGLTRRRLLVRRYADRLVQHRLGLGEGRHKRGPRTASVTHLAREGLADQHSRRRLHVPALAGTEAALPDRQLRDPLSLEHDGVHLQGQLANLLGCHRWTSREASSSSRQMKHYG
jgi:hypothetical protein